MRSAGSGFGELEYPEVRGLENFQEMFGIKVHCEAAAL